MKKVKKKKDSEIKRYLRSSLNFQRCDFTIIYLMAILIIFGIVMVFSASYYYSINESPNQSPYGYVIRHVQNVILGVILTYVCSVIDYQKFKKLTPLIVVGTIALLIIVLTPLGTRLYGAQRWIDIRVMTIMPGEIAKFAGIFAVASFLSSSPRRINNFLGGILPLLVLIGIFGVLIVKQPNLSTAITVCGMMIGIMFVAGLRWIYVAGLVTGAAGIVVLLILVKGGFWVNRILSFRDPFADPHGDGFQVIQSLYALGTGGFGGLGLGKSVQKNLYLPFAQNDFIMSIVGEELGFIGMLLVIIVFIVLIWKCFSISMNAPDRFGVLLGSGTTILIGLQVIIHIAVITSSMPPTGITMPFISYGGNSLWIFMALMGFIINISRQINEGKGQKRDRGRLST